MGKQINVALCLGFLLAPALQVAAAPQDPIASTAGDDAARKKQIEEEVRRLEAMFDKAQDEDQEKIVTLRGITVQALIQLVAIKTKYKYKFLYSEAENLLNVRIHYIVPEEELPKNDEDWFHFLKKVMAVSGYILIELKQKNETVYQVKQLGGPGQAVPLALVAKRKDGELGDLPEFDYIARYIELKHISTAEAVEIINQTLGGGGGVRGAAAAAGSPPIIELPVAGKILVVNYDYIVKRIEDILKEADRPQEELVLEIITLRNALSTQIQTVLTPMLEAITSRAPPSISPGLRRPPTGRGQPVRPTTPGAGQTEEVIQIIPDERTNSLIVLAEPYRIKRIKEIIKQIDEASGVGTFVVQVYRMKNTQALDMVPILRDVFSGQVTQGAQGQNGQQAQNRQSQQNQGGQGTGGTTGFGGLRPPTIVPDEPSNAVIVIADRNTQRKIEALISQVDVRRPQVYLKCSVVQITASDSFDIGIELAGLEAPRQGQIEIGGRTNFGQSTIADVDGDGVPDIVPDTTLAGGSLFLFKDRIGQLLANLHLNEGVTHIRVLEEPELIALDNTTAQVKVEVNVAVLRNDVTGTGILTTVFDHFEPASTILTISPHISEGGYVNLGLHIVVEKFLGTVSENTTIPPPKTTRQIFTNVNVPDRHTVVIGGLITNDASESTQGVPFLWKIPILGHLFRRDQSDSTKTTLYVFVTPTILFDKNYGDLKDVSATRKEEMDLPSSPLDQLDTGPPELPSVKNTWKRSPVLRTKPGD